MAERPRELKRPAMHLHPWLHLSDDVGPPGSQVRFKIDVSSRRMWLRDKRGEGDSLRKQKGTGLWKRDALDTMDRLRRVCPGNVLCGPACLLASCGKVRTGA